MRIGFELLIVYLSSKGWHYSMIRIHFERVWRLFVRAMNKEIWLSVCVEHSITTTNNQMMIPMKQIAGEIKEVELKDFSLTHPKIFLEDSGVMDSCIRLNRWSRCKLPSMKCRGSLI